MEIFKYGGLSPGEIINLLRVQKHDFLNHLQVIYGYLQLNKKEHALEYTHKTINSVQKNGKIMAITPSDLCILILHILQDAHNINAEPKLTVTSMLENLKKEEKMCEIIDASWQLIKSQLLRQEPEKRSLDIKVSETDDSYFFSFIFPYYETLLFKEEIERIKEISSYNQIEPEFSVTEAKGCIKFKVKHGD